jgi:HTH-type transcriptional regulator / antitoxin HigA
MIKLIRDEQSYTETLARIEALWGAADNTPEGDELDILLTSGRSL